MVHFTFMLFVLEGPFDLTKDMQHFKSDENPKSTLGGKIDR